MGLKERQGLYTKIEEARKRPLIAYVTSKRPGVDASMASDVIPYLIEQLDLIDKKETKLDILVASFGGDPMVAWKIMSLCRQRFKEIGVLVPERAFSAATLLAIGADEIVMHPNSNLGPVDMQVRTQGTSGTRWHSTEDISAFVDYVRETLSISDQKHLRKLFQETCKEIGAIGVGFAARTSKLAIELGQKMLAGAYGKGDEGRTKAKSIVEILSREFHAHSYPVSRSEALELELQVNKKRDEELETLMWDVWLDIEAELKERERWSPLTELMNNPEAAPKLLAPMPILKLPMNAPGPTWFQTAIKDIRDDLKPDDMVSPVDFSYIEALLESPRKEVRCVTRGKILATRMADMTIQYNAISVFRGWES